MRTDKQMFWTNADPIIAVMTNKHAVWNGAVMKLVRYAVRFVMFAAQIKLAVASVVFGSGPVPAASFGIDRNL